MAAGRHHTLRSATKRGLVWRPSPGAPTMDDSLSLFELPRAFVKPALEMCRTFNSTLDVAFYDVPTLVAELRARGAASIDLDALANPEGALLVVDPARAPFIQRFEDLKSFLDWKAGAEAPPKTVSITGVGSSALGSAAMAWDLAKRRARRCWRSCPATASPTRCCRASAAGSASACTTHCRRNRGCRMRWR
jgi:hypothetical protein